ncbi:MAG: response regulator [Rhodobacteraceae bacterium]|nr:response regulator [Paracoccaceae bacterium]
MKILSVDDDPIILELLTAVLASIGQTDVTTAESAMEALELIEKQDTPFDCFLLDIQMPKIDGIQLCKAVRLMPEYNRTPILMITAMSDKTYIDKAFVAGATDYVTKPFDVIELGARVRTAESLVNAWREKAATADNLVAQREYVGSEKAFELDEKFPIDDVEGVIDYVALENYVSQLSRGSLFGSSILAFSIVEINQLYRDTTAFDFEALITDVAEAVTICFDGNQSLVSYAGNGTFVCIIDSIDKAPTEILEQELRNTIASMDLCYSDGRSLVFTITAGDSIRLSFRSGQDVVKALSQAAKSARFKSEDMLPAQPIVPLDVFLGGYAG